MTEGIEDIEDRPAVQIVSRAKKLLAAIDESFIVSKRNHKIRPLPTFKYDEITLGKVLGTGGFGIVYEITNITVDRQYNFSNDDNSNPSAAPIEDSDQNEPPAINVVAQQPQKDDGSNDDGINDDKTNLQHPDIPSIRSVSTADVYSDQSSHIHYRVQKAKDWMEKCCCMTSSELINSRYALKRLQKGLTDIEHSRGILDLAIEAKYLSIVWHPNIIKIRGIAKAEPLSDDFFIIIDRLCETLEVRMDTWREEKKKHQNTFSIFRTMNEKKKLEQLLVERLTIAYDLAAAFCYLHEHKLVYRDIKPANIGFDHRGDVKVYDFGLCKCISTALKARDGEYGYELTGQAGSLPYMAPEVVLGKTYDSKCDVFSFAILLWEILSLQQCCKGYTPEKFVDRVTINQVRFPIKNSWPPLTRSMIPEAWDNDPQKRPDMKRVAILIRGDLNNMSADESVLYRTQHMIDRSNHGCCYFEMSSSL